MYIGCTEVQKSKGQHERNKLSAVTLLLLPHHLLQCRGYKVSSWVAGACPLEPCVTDRADKSIPTTSNIAAQKQH